MFAQIYKFSKIYKEYMKFTKYKCFGNLFYF